MEIASMATNRIPTVGEGGAIVEVGRGGESKCSLSLRVGKVNDTYLFELKEGGRIPEGRGSTLSSWLRGGAREDSLG